MANDINATSYRMLALITTGKLAQTASSLFRRAAIPIAYQCSAVGTASSEILNALGLGSTPKSVLIGMMPTPIARDMLVRLRKGLKLYAPGNGIAFTVALTGANNHTLRMLNTLLGDDAAPGARRNSMSESEITYALVAAVVNRGFSEEVMVAAKSAGARGGTVISSRRVTDEQAVQNWGLSFQEEKDVVLILAPAERKTAMMQAIAKRCGIASEAKGIVFSMPIDSVEGLGEDV